MTREHAPCVMCARFTTIGHVDEARKGNGYCEGWEKLVPWNWQPCVLFNAAKNVRQRETFAAKHSQPEPDRDQFARESATTAAS